jgi:porin
MKIALLCCSFLVFPALSHAQDSQTFGGPSGVTGEERDIREILDAYRVDNRKLHLKPWYDWKAGLKERSGFSFGVNAQMLYLGASDALGDEDDAAGGIYRLQGEWVLFGRGSSNPGSIVFRVENRSKIGSGIPPASLRGEIGAVATDPGFAYSDNFGTHFSVLAWQQFYANKRAAVAAGLLDFSAYVDAFYYQTISRGFLNRSFILSPTLATTGIGALGAVSKGFVSDNFWIGGGFYEGTPSGSGWLLSWSQKMAGRFVPFVRAGWSDGGGGALARRSLSAGISYRMAFQDWLTIGLGLNKPSDKTYQPGLSDEKVLEASYLWQITANTSLLPDLQLVLDPAQNPEESRIWTAGLRLRFVF